MLSPIDRAEDIFSDESRRLFVYGMLAANSW